MSPGVMTPPVRRKFDASLQPERRCRCSRATRGGTGSYPPGEKGWQRRMRRAPSHSPCSTPCSSIACAVYSEQVGVKRHVGGVKRDTRWYSRISPTRVFCHSVGRGAFMAPHSPSRPLRSGTGSASPAATGDSLPPRRFCGRRTPHQSRHSGWAGTHDMRHAGVV